MFSPIPIPHEASPINPPFTVFELAIFFVESLKTQIILRIRSSSPALYKLYLLLVDLYINLMDNTLNFKSGCFSFFIGSIPQIL